MRLKYNNNIEIEFFDSFEVLSSDLLKNLNSGNIALSGGSTYLKLLKEWAKEGSDFENITFYPVDERVVDFESSDSNWGNTYRNFLSKFGISPENHYINSDKYNTALEGIKMNTIFLGVGDDGHTASLFDSDTVFNFSNRKAISTISPKAPVERVSLTGNYIIEADNIIIIFSGKGKADIVRKVLNGDDLPITTLLKKAKRAKLYIDNELHGGINE